MEADRQTINLMGVHIDVIDTQGLCKKVIEFAKNGRSHKVMYINAECMLKALKDDEYREILNDAQLVYADGMSIVWGAKLFGHHLPGRSTGADFLPWFCKIFTEKGIRIFLLGARPGVAALAGEKLKQDNPNLKIVGTHHGYFQEKEKETVIKSINRTNPHILLIGFGAPYQEKWMENNFKLLDVPVVWGVGGSFDFISGRTKRGPQWLLDNGFEWLCRLCVEPKRLWRRYLIGNFLFVWHVLNWRYLRRRGRK